VGRSSTASVSVTVSNAPPSVSISSPQAGATISRTVTVSGFASSPAGIASVQVQVDSNAPVTASGTNGWSMTIDTTTLSQGAHTITATATDSLGRSSSTSISVTVSNFIQTHQSPWYLQDSTGNVSTVNETMMWDGDANQSSPLPTGTITFSVNSTIQPNDANTTDSCSQDPTTGYWSCVHPITSADLQWAPLAGGWSLHYAFQLQAEYPLSSTFTISYSGDANFAPSSAVAANT
jgi:Bacterial Ig domain